MLGQSSIRGLVLHLVSHRPPELVKAGTQSYCVFNFLFEDMHVLERQRFIHTGCDVKTQGGGSGFGDSSWMSDNGDGPIRRSRSGSHSCPSLYVSAPVRAGTPAPGTSCHMKEVGQRRYCQVE